MFQMWLKFSRIRLRLLVGAFLAVGLLLGLLCFSIGPDTGPVYQGKSVTQWINSIQSANGKDKSVLKLIAIGKPAVPYLARAAGWKPGLLDLLGEWVRRHRLPKPIVRLFPTPVSHREGAIYVLARIGRGARAALPVLRRVAKEKPENWTYRVFALSAIGCIGPEPQDVRLLVRDLHDTNWMCRAEAVLGLGRSGPIARSNAMKLKRLLRDPNQYVRQYVTEALAKIEAPNFSAPSSNFGKVKSPRSRTGPTNAPASVRAKRN